MPGPLVYEGNVPVTFVPAIEDITAPTATEIGGGEEMSSYIPKDGVQFPADRGMVDTGSLDRKFNSQYPGSTGGTLVITFKRQNRDGDSAAWEAFKAGEVAGYLVFGFEGSNDTEDDEVDVYQVVGHEPVRSNPAGDTEQRFVVNFGVQDEAAAVAVVAGA